jgi:hypothetical protein
MGLAFVFFLAALGIEVDPWRAGAAFALLIFVIEVHAARRVFQEKEEKDEDRQ